MPEFPRCGVDDIGDNPGIQELTEGFTQFFLRLELIHHGVEGGGEFPDFVARGDREGVGVFSIRRFMKGGGQPAKGGLEASRDQKENEEAKEGCGEKENSIGPNDAENVCTGF